MKRVLVAMAAVMTVLVSGAVSAAPGEGPMIHPRPPVSDVTGKVQVLYPRCFRAPCNPIVRVLNGEQTVIVKGDLANDLAAFDGRTVTVRGRQNGTSLSATAFAPGKTSDFVTGVVENRSMCTRSLPPVCRWSVVIKTPDGEEVQINDPEAAKKLAELSGSTITLRGDLYRIKCPPNARCIAPDGTYFRPNLEKNILVKGFLEKLPHGMNGQTHTLTFENGGRILVSGKQWGDRDNRTVWVSGKLGQEMISGAAMFIGTSASKPVRPIPAIEPFPGSIGDGANVARGSDTQGGVAAGAASGSTTSSAGTKR